MSAIGLYHLLTKAGLDTEKVDPHGHIEIALLFIDFLSFVTYLTLGSLAASKKVLPIDQCKNITIAMFVLAGANFFTNVSLMIYALFFDNEHDVQYTVSASSADKSAQPKKTNGKAPREPLVAEIRV